MKKAMVIIALFGFTLTFLGIIKQFNSYVSKIESIEITQNRNIEVGEETKIDIRIEPKNVSDKRIIWKSSNPDIAEVDEEGKVIAYSEGKVRITASSEDGKVFSTCVLTIKKRAYDKKEKSEKELENNSIEGKEEKNNSNITSQNSKSNSQNSNNTSKNNKKNTTDINTKNKRDVKSVSLNHKSISIVDGKSVNLTATISPSNATNKNVTWASSNTSVATVSSSGVVTAKSVGTATITVTTKDGSKKATCEVTVTPIRVSGVTLGSSSEEIIYLNNKTLTATVSPSNAANKNVTWSSSNTSVATVSSTGVVTAKSVGTATITVTTADGSKKDTTNITVKPLPIVYFVAHQDDETISASGSILEDLKSGSNVDVHVYLCTDGAGSGVYNQIINGQTKITGKNASNFTRTDFSLARDKEYTAALQQLGVNKNNIHILKYTNDSGNLTRFEDGKLKDNKSKLKTVLNNEIKKYTNPVIRAHVPLLTKILSISKNEGKNHYHKDHVTIGNVIYELYSSNTSLINMSENDIHNLRFFTDENWTDSDYETTEFKSRYKKYPQTLTSSDKEKWNNARNEYERFEPNNGRYSIGGLSVESQFVNVKNRMDNKGYLNHYFSIGTLYKNNLVTTSTDY